MTSLPKPDGDSAHGLTTVCLPLQRRADSRNSTTRTGTIVGSVVVNAQITPPTQSTTEVRVRERRGDVLAPTVTNPGVMVPARCHRRRPVPVRDLCHNFLGPVALAGQATRRHHP